MFIATGLTSMVGLKTSIAQSIMPSTIVSASNKLLQHPQYIVTQDEMVQQVMNCK